MMPIFSGILTRAGERSIMVGTIMKTRCDAVSTEQLISLCVAGDKDAWVVFIQRYSSLLYKAISSRLAQYSYFPTQQEREDIFCTFMLSLIEKNKLAAIHNKKNINYWLIVSAGNAALEYVRKERSGVNTVSLSAPIDPRGEIDVTYGHLLSQGADTYDVMYEKELSDSIRDVIRGLSSKERIALELNVLFGHTHKEIADLLNMPINTVSTIIKRSKDKVREKLIQKGVS
jgi:RNA polymerase sigma-70 factor (ECF subfamily)